MAAEDNGPVSEESHPIRIGDWADAVDAANTNDNASSREKRAIERFNIDFLLGEGTLKAPFRQIFVGQ